MPYMIRKHNGKHKVYKRGDNGQPVGTALGKHKTRTAAVDQLRALYANEPSNKAASAPTSPKDYAVVPDKNKPSTWKMPIHDRRHVGLAIAALNSDKNAPHGHGADLTPEQRAQAISRISKRIGKHATDKADEADLRSRLAQHGSKDYYDPEYSRKEIKEYLDSPLPMPSTYSIKLDPDDPRVAYDPLGGSKTKACANCAWFNAYNNQCQLVEGPIVATGVSNLWLAQDADPDDDTDDKIDAIMQLLDADDASKEMIGFKTFGDDNQYWVAYFSNNAQDRDGEWFAQSAHDKAIARIDMGEIPMPKLDYWHSKAYHGEAFWVGRKGHIVMAVGKFWNDPFSQGMKQYYAKSKATDNLVSFGYFYPRSALIDNVYHDYTPFEISPLPAEVAANLWTGFASVKEFKNMTISKEKRKELERRLGPALAAQLIAQAGQKSQALDAIETDFKSYGAKATLESELRDLRKQVKKMRRKAAAGKFADKPAIPTKHQGQPRNTQEADDHVDEDLDDEDKNNIGALDKENRALKKQLQQLKLKQQIAHAITKANKATRKAAASSDDGDDGDDDGNDDNAGGDDTENTKPADNGKSKKRRNKQVRTPIQGLEQLANGFKQTNDALLTTNKAIQQISQSQQALANQINALANEIYNPTPATRSSHTVIPPGNEAVEALAMKMNGAGAGDQLPGQPSVVALNDMAELLGFPTAFGGRNGRGG